MGLLDNNRDIYLKWRNIIILIILMIIIVAGLGYLSSKASDEIRDKKDIAMSKFKNAVTEYNAKQKNVPLKTDIITKCINGKKAIIVNGIFYYVGDIDTWGDIKGVDCE